MKKFILLTIILASFTAFGQNRAFPVKEGFKARYEVLNAKGEKDYSYVLSLRNITGDEENGTLKMVYLPYDADGKLLFNKPSEYVIGIVRENGNTVANMPEINRLIKMQKVMPSGDAGSVPAQMSVGQSLPQSFMQVNCGKVKCSMTITDKKVKDHKTIQTPAGALDCWLVHEKTTVKSPITTETFTSETWYSVGIGIVRQTVYDSKGNIRKEQKLISLK